MDPVQPDLVKSEPEESSINKVLKISLIVLIIITIGFGGFVLFSINKNKTLPNAITNISPTVAMDKDIKITPIPTTIATDNPSDIDVGSVEADLKGIETEVKGLQ